MSVRNRRSGLRNPVAFFEALRATRQACTDQLRNLPILGPEYKAMLGVIAALDAAADLFTGTSSFYVYSRQPDMIGRNQTDAGT